MCHSSRGITLISMCIIVGGDCNGAKFVGNKQTETLNFIY